MRRLVLRFCSVLLVSMFAITSCWAQTAIAGATATVPPLVKVSGTLANAQGTVGVTFALYAEQTGGAPLWLETQNVTPDANGRYTIYLGVNHANGVPLNLFASGEARWLGVQPEGQPEQTRAQLVSVPYALTAGDAQTLGGQPLSAFVLASSAANGTTTSGGVTTTASAGSGGVVALATPQTGGTVITTGGTTGYLAKFTATTDVESSTAIYDSSTATTTGFVGIGPLSYFSPTNSPLSALHVVTQTPPAAYFDTYSGSSTTVLNVIPTVNRSARGTPTNPSAVQLNDYLAGMAARGYGATKFANGGRSALRMQAAENWTDTNQGTYMSFWTSGTGTTVSVERMRVDPFGNLGIGTQTPTSPLTVMGVIQSASGLNEAGQNVTGGFKFPDNTVQTTAFTGTTGGTYTAGAGLMLLGNQFSVPFGTFQAPVTGICSPGMFMTSITSTGGVNCSAVTGGAYATLVSNTFVGNQTVQGAVDVSDNGTFNSTWTNPSVHTIHGESNRAGVVFTSQDVNSYFPNTPAGVFGISNDQTVDAFSNGVKGLAVGPWGTGVSGISLDTTPGSDDSPTGVGGRVYSASGGANGVVAKILGPTTATNYSTAAYGTALTAEAVSINATPGMFVNVNGRSNGNNTGNILVGNVCNPTSTSPAPSNGWQSWHDCPSVNRQMVFRVDTFGNIYGNSFRRFLTNSSSGTLQYYLAQLVPGGSPTTMQLATAGTTTTNGIIGVVVSGSPTTPTTSGSAMVALEGYATCQFDNAVTAGDLVQASTNVAGQCHDAGTQSSVSNSSQVLGYVVSTNTNSGQQNTIFLFGPSSMLAVSNGGGGGGGGVPILSLGSGLTGSLSSSTLALNIDYTQVQPLLTGLTTASCGTNQFVTKINSDGTVLCGNTGTITPGALVLSSGGQVTGPVSIIPPATGASSIYAVSATQTQQGVAMPGSGGSGSGGAAPSGGGGGGGPTAAWIASVPAAVVGTATDQSGNVAAGVVGVGTGPGDLAMVATSVGTLPTMFVWNENTSTTGGHDNNPSAINAQTSAGVGQVIEADALAAAGPDPTCNNCSELTVISTYAGATSGTVNLFTGEATSPYANGIQLQFDTPLTTSCPQGTQCQLPSVFDASDNSGHHFNIDGGFNVSTSGNLSANNATFNSLSVNNGFSSLTVNGETILNSGLNVSGGATFNAGLGVNNGISVNTGSVYVPAGVITSTISSLAGQGSQPTTLTIQAGTTSFGGEVSIPSGYLTVSGAGSFGGPLSANNGLTVSGGGGISDSGGLTVAGGATLQNGLLVMGGLSVTGVKNFKIDDPLDPANKYLYHASIESSEMMNLYSGTVALDKRGNAWVQLPDWFEALNKDFRYQLTAIGAPGPNLYVAKEISDNRFKIAGGKPGMKVSWQVTGVRHDAWADAHRMQVEVDKTGKERGTYLHPELFPEKTALAQKK